MNELEINKAQSVLLNVTKIVETECYQDATKLLEDGFVLLCVGHSVFEDNDNRFVYSLGLTKPIDQLSEWTQVNFC